ncbi:DUF402 domain-containing protein [Alicyclobacillus cycloheptanicus]|uniref:Protein associated with RNAse G/E n=1 Tax=Alicyclobacillus cycloheptanicus TaxID=1457 RepID=A0ABT9XM04_9BACL|nr:DUF402 domain-containing protein [Alicyclobacillus cycloheptanicus]MDQ0190758.1 protein associated with RNAse G/E [Alicyclobacillus cycloheptanicus]WDL99857.1 DUF402 domain-containing protein [Alicyclobacillus cycloheptanicus]
MNVQLVSSKLDGSPHRIWRTAVCTRDPWAFCIPPGGLVEDADGRVWSSDYPVVALFWPGCCAQVFVLLRQTDTAYYCNLIAPPVYDPCARTIQFADLDLDVWVSEEGVNVLDEDEFEAHKANYPGALVRRVLRTKAELVHLAARRAGPFSLAAAARWRAAVR